MPKIVFVGDSVTHGTSYGGVTTPDTFAYKVGVANGYAPADIVNAGVNGDTSAGLLSRLSTDVLAFSPAVAVVEIGLNDWAASVPIATFSSNIGSIISTLKGAGIKPIGMSKMQRGSTADFVGQNDYWQAFEAVCVVQAAPVIDLYREECASYLYLTSSAFYANYVDVVHLTVAGHQFVTALCSRSTHAGWFY